MSILRLTSTGQCASLSLGVLNATQWTWTTFLCPQKASPVCHSVGGWSQFSCLRPPHSHIRPWACRDKLNLLQPKQNHLHLLSFVSALRSTGFLTNPSISPQTHRHTLTPAVLLSAMSCSHEAVHCDTGFLLSCSDKHDFLWLFTTQAGERGGPLFCSPTHSSSFQLLPHRWPSVVVIQPINEPSKMFFVGNDNSKIA